MLVAHLKCDSSRLGVVEILVYGFDFKDVSAQGQLLVGHTSLAGLLPLLLAAQ